MVTFNVNCDCGFCAGPFLTLKEAQDNLEDHIRPLDEDTLNCDCKPEKGIDGTELYPNGVRILLLDQPTCKKNT